MICRRILRYTFIFFITYSCRTFFFELGETSYKIVVFSFLFFFQFFFILALCFFRVVFPFSCILADRTELRYFYYLYRFIYCWISLSPKRSVPLIKNVLCNFTRLFIYDFIFFYGSSKNLFLIRVNSFRCNFCRFNVEDWPPTVLLELYFFLCDL